MNATNTTIPNVFSTNPGFVRPASMNRWDDASAYPRDVTASPIAAAFAKSASSKRVSKRLPTSTLPRHPNARQSTSRAANPKLKLRTSSKTMDVNLNDSNNVKMTSSTGTRSARSGAKYHRNPLAIASGVVTHNAKCALCNTVNVNVDDVTAKLIPFRVNCNGPT
eukprot:CAMPEP_0179700696 /NCGR_PEP_ID=MMETSP0937-20121108/1386_1 /TAXON_ID=548131 ORGANISM="Ostreococcus mediterraneus, Strain clade-D-RCC2593" /NCGR_SAMPLE_ID=MMETSP0937 /ASSEMBLY_ACC=CAM_ASM_000575 /LENGTH=164 /DNA_ID=CAMNT_0021573789 /DNA_START=23 /DNA_END=517 /DNA_ORIENTATION=+